MLQIISLERQKILMLEAAKIIDFSKQKEKKGHLVYKIICNNIFK